MKIPGLLLLFLGFTSWLTGQSTSFDSFISRLSQQYNVDVAVAPELIPVLDSVKNSSSNITSVEDFLRVMLQDKDVTYRIVDGNKVLLRRNHYVEPGDQKILIQGTVMDKSTRLPLMYSAVSVVGTNRGTYTDEQGQFKLYVDPATSALQISYLGYKPATYSLNRSGLEVKVEMEADNITLDQVVVVVPFHQIEAGDGSIDLKGYQYISAEDLLHWSSERLITHLTGYTHFSSEEGIRIRSSEEENSLIMMDGIPVYDPYHFYNIFSPFNGQYFSSVNLYKNNMPVNYGGRIDGLIELSSTKGVKGTRLILDTDLLLTSLAGEMQITKNISLAAGGRISHTRMLNGSFRDSSTTTVPGRFRNENEWTSSQEPAFSFYDVNLGLNAGIGKDAEITFAYFKSKDYLDNTIRNDLSATILNHEVVSIEQEIQSRDDWDNEGFAMELETRLKGNMHFTVNGFLSFFEKNIEFDASLDERYPQMSRTSFNSGFQNSVFQSRGFKAFINNDSIAGGYTLGMDVQQHEVDLLAKENTTPYLLAVQEEAESTLFGEYKLPVADKLIVSIGGRVTHLSNASKIYPQPNVSINYPVNETWKLKASFSKNIQAVRELTVENRFGRETDFLALSQVDAGYPVLRSDKYMLGAHYTSDRLTVDGELYYKNMDGLLSVRAPKPDPSFQDGTSPGEFYRLFEGSGWTAGFDLLASYKTAKWETSVSYTLSKIAQQFDQLFNGNEFSPKEDRRHQLKVSSQYRMGQFIASALLTYKTKAPYVSLVKLEGQGGIGDVDQVNVIRYLPPYFSLDLALDYSFRIGNQTALLGASVINASDHANINDLQHIGRIMKNQGMQGLFLTNETELLGRTMNVHFRLLLF